MGPITNTDDWVEHSSRGTRLYSQNSCNFEADKKVVRKLIKLEATKVSKSTNPKEVIIIKETKLLNVSVYS